jgi:hypothetical protein
MRSDRAQRLREAWHGPLTAAEVAKAFRMASAQMVRKFWGTEKDAGRLPDADRPYFASAKASPAEPDLAGDVPYADGSPIADPNPRFDAQCDAALAALRKHHANLDDIAAQTSPAAWLRFDGKGMPVPTHQMLMAMCRAFDQSQTKGVF